MNLQKVPLYRNVACYYCNEFFEEPHLQNHLKQCSQVLVPCRYKCGVFVLRRNSDKHAQECLRRIQNPTALRQFEYPFATLPRPNAANENRHSVVQLRPKSTSSALPTARNSLPTFQVLCQQSKADLDRIETKIMNQEQICRSSNANLARIQSHQAEHFEHMREIEETITKLKLFQNDIAQRHLAEKSKVQLEFEKVQLKHNLIDEWLKQLKSQIEQIVITITDDNEKHKINFEQYINLEQRLTILERLNSEIIALKRKIYQDRKINENNLSVIKDEFVKFKEYLSTDNVRINTICSEQMAELNKFKTELTDVDSELKELNLKEHANSFELKVNMRALSENRDKLVILQRDVDDLKKSFTQLQHDYEELINNCSSNSNSSFIESTNGHLLWKIINFSEKLSEAKESDLIVRSPLFFSSLYGYKLRIEAHLNGIGKWKDRHLIMTVQILKGEWDPLLDWPCYLQAAVILKDQSDNKNERCDLVKTLTVKRKFEEIKEDLTENSCQHIFISHKTLNENNYLKNDTVFFEIKVNNENLLKN